MRLFSLFIMLGVIGTWTWILRIVAQREPRPAFFEVAAPTSASEPEAEAPSAVPPPAPAIEPASEQDDAASARPAAPPAAAKRQRAGIERSAAVRKRPPPAATDGAIVITSDPPGARVTVDGIGWGVTPLTVQHLPFGSKRVRITMDGYTPAQRSVRVSEDRPRQTLHFRLRQ